MIELNNLINWSLLLRLAAKLKSRKKAKLETLEPQKDTQQGPPIYMSAYWLKMTQKSLALKLWRHPIKSDVSPKMHRLKQLGL